NLVAGVEALFHQALPFHTAVVGMGKDGAADLLGIAAFFEDFVAHERVLGRGGIFFIIEIVQQAGDAPLVFVLAELAGVGAHTGLNGQHVLAQALRLGVFAKQAPGLGPVNSIRSIRHWFLPVFSVYSPVLYRLFRFLSKFSC